MHIIDMHTKSHIVVCNVKLRKDAKGHLYCSYPSSIVCIQVVMLTFGIFIDLKGYGGKLSVKNMLLEGLDF